MLSGVDESQHQVFLIRRAPVAEAVQFIALSHDQLDAGERDFGVVKLLAARDDDVMHDTVDQARADEDAALFGPGLVDCGDAGCGLRVH
ncbi:hypothetical protein D3C71_1800650 [compost metagenome]